MKRYLISAGPSGGSHVIWVSHFELRGGVLTLFDDVTSRNTVRINLSRHPDATVCALEENQ